ncbi:MAG: sodium:solute symporter family protein [Candidatus Latescibacteria bacterium]|nr:sodium:solute symporter family protein [bacterium]MCB9516133.1 sodium:solute symporter family protein [Candidatus Latescibacterota bacterium]
MFGYSGSELLRLGIIAAYLGFIFVKGTLKARKIGEADDFLLAGRNVPWWMLFATMGATVIGGGYSIGAVGKTYEWGLLMVLVSTAGYLHFLFSGLFVAPHFRRAELYTVAGYFGHRFGEGPRFVVLVVSLLFSVFIIAAQMAAFGTVLSTLLPNFADNVQVLRWAIIVGGAMVVIYSTAGGLMAVIYTDIIQFVVLYIGFLVTAAICLPELSANWGTITTTVPDGFFSPEGGKGWLFLVTTFLAFLFGETFAPGYATRYCVGRSIRDTKLGIAGVGGFLMLTFPVIIFVIALYGRMWHGDITAQQALPVVVKDLNNPIIGAILIAALLSAVMSSADSALNSSTAIFVKDLFEHQLGWEDKGDGRILRLARWCSAGLGIAATAIAVLWPDIISLLLFTYHLWAPAIIVPVVVGVFSKERSPGLTRMILTTMLIAIAVTFAYRFTPWAETFDPAVFGVLVATVAFASMVLTRRLRPAAA